ncbi:MAG: UMP phosphatase, partial [Planctomycetota bacterium]
MTSLSLIKAIICDMDGVILRDHHLLPGAKEFIENLLKGPIPFVFLTNYPSQTPSEQKHRLGISGVHVPEEHFYTSAMATAAFLENQTGRTAYVIGESGLTHELYKIGFT